MQIDIFLQFLLFFLSSVGGITLLILAFKNSNQSLDYEKIIKNLNEQKQHNLDILEKGNKTVDDIENKILECKKELGINLFKRKKK